METIIVEKLDRIKQNLPKAMKFLENCCVCPRNCNINRVEDQRGFCGIGRYAIVNKIKLEKEKEDYFYGTSYSGKIYFSSCNLRCFFCKDYKISQTIDGDTVTAEELAEEILKLQESGAQNIHFVSPTHVGPQIMEALEIAYSKGLNLPLIYNSNGFDVLKMLRLWEGIMDIFLVDMKYGDKKLSKKYSFAFNYPKVSKRALIEMLRQAGNLEIDENGLAAKGVVVRHLVLPEGISHSEEVFEMIAAIDPNITLNICFDYSPEYKAFKFKEINRKLNYQEIKKIKLLSQFYGLKNIEFFS